MEVQQYLVRWAAQNATLLVTVSVLVVILSRILYNAFWHPLAQIPGPFFSRVSGIPSYFYAARGDRHLWLWRLHQTYGSKFRIDPNTVIFAGPEAYGDIYSMKANVQRSSFYPALQKSALEENTLTVTDPAVHAHKRKLLNLSFTERSLRAASGFMINHIDGWNELLTNESDDWSPPKDMTTLTDALTFDIMTDLSFGKSAEIKEPGENPLKNIPHCMDEYLQFIYPITRSPMLDWWLWLRTWGLDALFAALAPPDVKNYYKFVEDCLNDRLRRHEEQNEKLQQDGQRQDMLYFLCQAKNPDTGDAAYTKAELFGEAVLLIVTGGATTASSMSAFFFYITRDSMRYEKLVREIRTTFDTAEEIIVGPKLSGCTYLKACVDEAIRLAPPGPSEHAREVRPGGTTIDGDYYPAGVIVGAAPWVTLRNESVFTDSAAFKPERFIVDPSNGVTAEDVSRTRSGFHPFATGPNACPGKNMAMQEMLLTLARTLHRYDVRKAPGSTLGEGSENQGWGRKDPGTFQLSDAYVSIRKGPLVQFRKRGSP